MLRESLRSLNLPHVLRRALWRVGLDVARFSPTRHDVARLRWMFRTYAIDSVLDVGANVGQFALKLRADVGYRGRICSFEPSRAAFAQLLARARRDRAWDAFNFALGEVDGAALLNIAGNSLSSSLLPMLPAHLKAAPESACVGRDTTQIRSLDSLFDELCPAGSRVYLKVDVQGFQKQVLAGAARCLPRIDTVQLEMSLVPLYEGEALVGELCAQLRDEGYTLLALEPGFCDEASGQLLQVDGIFRRELLRADEPPRDARGG